jgi:hypothetical protein
MLAQIYITLTLLQSFTHAGVCVCVLNKEHNIFLTGFMYDCISSNGTSSSFKTYVVDNRCMILTTTITQTAANAPAGCIATMGKMSKGRLAIISRPNMETFFKPLLPVGQF